MIGNIHLSELSNEVIEYINNSNNSTPAIYGELNYEKGTIRVLTDNENEFELPITLDYDLNDLMFVYLNGRLLRDEYYTITEDNKIVFNSVSLKQGNDIDIYLLSIINKCGEHPGGGTGGGTVSNITKEQLAEALRAEIDGKASAIHTHTDIIELIPDLPTIATTEQAQSGIDDTTMMTPKKTKEAIAALGGTGGGLVENITKSQLHMDLQTEIDNKALKDHNHDSNYSPIIHTHEDIVNQIPKLPTIASTEQAQAGIDNTTMMTPARVKEAIVALGGDSGPIENITKEQLDLSLQTEIDGKAVKDHNHDLVYSSITHTHEDIIQQIPDIASTQQAQEGIDNTTIMTPARVKEAIVALGGGSQPVDNITKEQLDLTLQAEIDGKALAQHTHLDIIEQIPTVPTIASTEQATAGTDNTTIMTPVRVKEAITALGITNKPTNIEKTQLSESLKSEIDGKAAVVHTHEEITSLIPTVPTIASTEQATAGTDDTTIMTPKKTKEAIVALASTEKPTNIEKTQLSVTLQTEIDGKALKEHTHDDIVAKIPTIANTEQATAGTDNTTIMTPIRVKEAITAIAPTIAVKNISKEQLDLALQGEIDSKADVVHNHDSVYSSITHNHDVMYSKVDHTHTDIIEQIPKLPVIATTEQAQAGIDNATMMTPARVKEAIDALGSSVGAIENITKAQLHVDLQTEIDGKAQAIHTHTASDITVVSDSLPGNVQLALDELSNRAASTIVHEISNPLTTSPLDYLNLTTTIGTITQDMVIPLTNPEGNIPVLENKFLLKGGKTYIINMNAIGEFSSATAELNLCVYDSKIEAVVEASKITLLPLTSTKNTSSNNISEIIVTPTTDTYYHITPNYVVDATQLRVNLSVKEYRNNPVNQYGGFQTRVLFEGSANTINQYELLDDVNNYNFLLVETAADSGIEYLVPKMTSANTPSPFVISSSDETNASYLAFDGVVGAAANSWYASTTLPHWIKVDAGSPISISGLKITNPVDSQGYAGYSPKSFIIEGSNDDAIYTEIHKETAVSAMTPQEVRNYEFTTEATYRYYRMTITEGYGGTGVIIGEMNYIRSAKGNVHTSLILVDINTHIDSYGDAYVKYSVNGNKMVISEINKLPIIKITGVKGQLPSLLSGGVF